MDARGADTCPNDPERRRELSAWAIARAKSLGFAAAGVCEALPSERGVELRQWIDRGSHGPMEWFAKNVEARLDVRVMFPGARSILVVADRYHDGTPDPDREVLDAASGIAPTRIGRVARYARGRDYHRRMKRRLRVLQREFESALPGVRGKVCCDIEPFMEREHAERAGLGRCGKHTLLIIPGLGSWVLLAAYVTTALVEPTLGKSSEEWGESADPCGSCTRCIDACPTQAIVPWGVDSRRCLSSVTIEERGTPDPEVAARAGQWLLGCDICQEVCPHNQPTRRSVSAGRGADYDGRNAAFDLLEVLGWDDAKRRSAFGPSALNRVKADQVRRNAVWCSLRVLREEPSHPLGDSIRKIAGSATESAHVQAAAHEVLARIQA